MSPTRRRFSLSAFMALSAFSLGLLADPAAAATAADLDKDADQALQALYRLRPVAQTIARDAKAILVFPKIVKAGLVFGGSYGEGVLIKGGNQAREYFNSVSATWGWQAGAESYAYVVFLMNEKAMDYLAKTQGWEFGIGPTLVVVNDGVAANLSTTTLKGDAYAFITDQQGLMASLSIEGTKVSRIKR